MRASSAAAHYLSFTRPVAAAIRRHQIGHVVGISSAGRNWPHPAGLLSVAFAMDAELERSGAAYRSLGMPFYMENLLGQLPRITSEGVFSLPLSNDRPLATIATRDIAATAAGLIMIATGKAPVGLPVFGPGRLDTRRNGDDHHRGARIQVAFEQADLKQLTAS